MIEITKADCASIPNLTFHHDSLSDKILDRIHRLVDTDSAHKCALREFDEKLGRILKVLSFKEISAEIVLKLHLVYESRLANLAKSPAEFAQSLA